MNKSGKALALPAPQVDENWDQIVDNIVESITNEDLPEKVVEGLEMMLVGFPIPDIAKELKVRPETVRGWITRYPIIGRILADHRPNLIKWRMAKMYQQFYQALKLSKKILEIDFTKGCEGSNADPKLVSALGAHVRFMLSLFMGQRVDVTVTHEAGDSLLRANQNALDYVSNRLYEQLQKNNEEPIEISYRVIDPKYDKGPMLDVDGNPNHGDLGKMDINQDGALCHICGKRYKALRSHITRQHNIEPANYETIFMLESGSIRDKYDEHAR